MRLPGTRMERLLQWVIRQRYKHSIGNAWLGTLVVVISVISGQAYGPQTGVAVFLGITVLSYAWGWFLLAFKLQSYEMEYVALINPVMKKLLKNTKRSEHDGGKDKIKKRKATL